jgi:hypothetical protein
MSKSAGSPLSKIHCSAMVLKHLQESPGLIAIIDIQKRSPEQNQRDLENDANITCPDIPLDRYISGAIDFPMRTRKFTSLVYGRRCKHTKLRATVLFWLSPIQDKY